jgi:hypothetical protein
MIEADVSGEEQIQEERTDESESQTGIGCGGWRTSAITDGAIRGLKTRDEGS